MAGAPGRSDSEIIIIVNALQLRSAESRNSLSYLTDVPSIRCWRRDRRSESTFARGDDERAVTEEFLSNKPKTVHRKVGVRLRRTANSTDERQLYDGRSSAYSIKTRRLRPAHRLRGRKLTRNAGLGVKIGYSVRP